MTSALTAGTSVPHVDHAAGMSRRRLLFGVLLTTAMISFGLAVVSYLDPVGGGSELPRYADIAAHRDFLWIFFVTAAMSLIVGVCAVAVAGWILVPAKGAAWATVGGSMIWLGAAAYGVGIGGWAAAYYVGTDPEVLSPSGAATLVDHINDDAVHLLALPIAGTLLVGLGGALLAVGLWRAGSVPRWLPPVSVAAQVATLLAPPSTAAGVLAEAASSFTTAALGWYVVRLSVPNPGPPPALERPDDRGRTDRPRMKGTS